MGTGLLVLFPGPAGPKVGTDEGQDNCEIKVNVGVKGVNVSQEGHCCRQYGSRSQESSYHT